jgi:hypothetical protein
MTKVTKPKTKSHNFSHQEKGAARKWGLVQQAARKLDIILPGETPPDSFFALAGKEDRGKYPGVFVFTSASYSDWHGFNYWAMLLWDRVILTVGFQWPICQCAECSERFSTPP